MKYILLIIPCMMMGMHHHEPSRSAPSIHVETVTRVLKDSTRFIDSDNNLLVSDSTTVVEVILRIHKLNRPVKVITLNVDI